MADIAKTIVFDTNPYMTAKVSYQTQRVGTTIRVRFRTEISPIVYPHYFGYRLRLDITFNGSLVCDKQYIKDNSPRTWSSPLVNYWPSSSGWYEVYNVTTQRTIPAVVMFRTDASTPNKSVGDTIAVPAYKYPTAPSSLTLSSSVVANANTNFTISWSGAKNGTTQITKYRVRALYNSSWRTVKTISVSKGSTSGSTTTSLSGITSTRGSTVTFAMDPIDEKELVGTGGQTKNVTLARLPTAPTTVNVSDSTVAQPTTNVTVSWSGASAGSGNISKYRIYYRTSTTASWTTLKDVTGTSTTVNLNGIVTTRGNLAYFTVGTINSYSLVSATDGPAKTITLARLPTIPTALTISNYNPKRTDSITLSWSGATAGSGTINNYFVDVRRYKNGNWSEWQNISDQTATSYTWQIISTYSDLVPNDIVQVRIGVRNSYSLTAGTWKYGNDVTIKGGVIRVKVNGSWKEGIAYVKVNGTWKEASSVYINSNGVWKESL